MKKYFSQLRPFERRLAIGILVVVFLVLNYVFIWPHFSDWGNLRRRMGAARQKLKLYQTAIAQTDTYQEQVDGLQSQANLSHRKTRPSTCCAPSSRNPRRAA